MLRIWDDILSEQDKAVIEKAGYARRGNSAFPSRGVGVRPAILVIDMQQLIVGRNVPILEAMEDYATAIGSIAWNAIAHMVPFLEQARSAGTPLIYTRARSRDYRPDDPALQIVDAVAPQEDDPVIDKDYPSAFFGTTLLTQLIQRQVDTVIIVGNSTSGCVRATAVDARQYGFHVVLPEECIFDRIEASHKIGLLDLWMKYAEVISTEQSLVYLRRVACANEEVGLHEHEL